MPLEGVDVSHSNAVIDWPRVKAAGISFAFVKTTEGLHFVDPKWTTNVAGCRAAGIVPGQYHFYRHDVDPEAQAAFFLQTLGKHEPGDLPPAIDVESPGDGSGPISYPATEVVHRVGIVVDAIQRELRISPMIYTYPSVWADVAGNSNAFVETCPLWIASYAATPRLPGGWTDYAVWQYTDHGRVDGIATIVDRDRLSGDAAQLDALRARTLAKSGMAIFTQDANVREEAGLTAPVVKVLRRGTGAVIIDGPVMVKDRDWWKIDDGDGTVGWSSSKVLSPA